MTIFARRASPAVEATHGEGPIGIEWNGALVEVAGIEPSVLSISSPSTTKAKNYFMLYHTGKIFMITFEYFRSL